MAATITAIMADHRTPPSPPLPAAHLPPSPYKKHPRARRKLRASISRDLILWSSVSFWHLPGLYNRLHMDLIQSFAYGLYQARSLEQRNFNSTRPCKLSWLEIHYCHRWFCHCWSQTEIKHQYVHGLELWFSFCSWHHPILWMRATIICVFCNLLCSDPSQVTQQICKRNSSSYMGKANILCFMSFYHAALYVITFWCTHVRI